jgi:hypothetical protein
LHPYAIGVLLISLLLAVLAVARITRVIVEDRIAVGVRQWVVRRWGEDGKMAYLFHCPWCMSLWVSLLVMPPAAIFPNQWVMAALAIPAGSMVAGLLLDTFVREEK